MRLARSPTVLPLAAALAGLYLGACSGTLYDAAGVPPLAPGGTTCDPPQHTCSSACVPQSTGACGDACTACTVSDLHATATCDADLQGVYACGQYCQAGWLPCASGCCRATAAAAGDDHACAVTSDGGLACWGRNDAGQLGPAAAGLARSERPIAVPITGVAAVAAGGRHTCAVAGGTVRCWGANESGQLGDGSSSPAATIASTGLTGATALALGASHSCAIVGTGAAAVVWCWGANGAGQLGLGTVDSAPHVVPVASMVSASTTALAAAGDDTCAVAAGAASCWGLDVDGQTGSNDQVVPRQPKPTPVPVPLSGSALMVAVGRRHACATSNGGGGTPLSCWGSGGEGEMGNGSTTPLVQLTPVQASRIDNNRLASIFVAGDAFTCSAKAGEVAMKCAGRNDMAQCGLAPPASAVGGADVSFSGTVLAASAGRAFTCALVDQAGVTVVMCWGLNDNGQLGHATPASASWPNPGVVGG